MSLQGTIETFAIADVLRLLAATNKSGRLQVQGPARSGTVWVDSGNILGAESPNTPNAHVAADVLFQLLRFDRGSFRFELDRSPPEPSEPVAIETALHDAEAMVAEWRELEQSIPSVDAWVALAESLPDGSVSISSEQWRGIKAIGSGRTVTALGDALELGELPVYRAVSELLQLGVVEVGSPPENAPVDASSTSASTSTSSSTASSFASASAETAAPAYSFATTYPEETSPFGDTDTPLAEEAAVAEATAAPSGSGPIATSVAETEAPAEEGDARRRLDALASSLGLPASPENGSFESAVPPPPPAPVTERPAFTSFAPPPPAAPSTAGSPEGVRAEAGLSASADSNGVTEASAYSPTETTAAGANENGVAAGTELIGSAAENPIGETTLAETAASEVSEQPEATAPGDGGTAQPAYGAYGQQQSPLGEAPPAPVYGEYGQQPAYGEYGQQQPAYGEYGQQQQPAYGEYGQQQPAYGEYGQQQPAYGEYGQQQQPAYGEYGQQQQPAYGEYGQQQPAYGEYGQQQPAYGEYGQQQQPAYGEHGQQTSYPTPPAYGYEAYADPNQSYGQPQPAPYAPEAEAWVPPAPPVPEPSADAQPAGTEVRPSSDPTTAWPANDEVTRARTIFESTAPPPPPPPPAPGASREAWQSGSTWYDGPAPERIAPPPPPPPPPMGTVDAESGRSDALVLTDHGAQAGQSADEDPANIERQLFNLSDRAREAVKRSSGLFEGRSRR